MIRNDDEVLDRPEWVTCVSAGDGFHSLCGREVPCEFVFVSEEHARMNEANEGRLTTCPECAAKMERAA